ncbi:MAG: hypothetical protein ABSE45_06705 [Candidatus Acidiferrales bacterium]|jgi:hypothetical protein
MHTKLWLALLCIAANALTMPLLAALRQGAEPDSNTVDCRVLEAHASTTPPVIVIVFHQRDKQDQARFAALLRQNSGAEVAIRGGDAQWTNGTVVRMKTCFGRGLLLLPGGAPMMKEGVTFRLRFPRASGGN